MMPNVNMSPVIMEKIIVTKGPVKRTAPAKNIKRNQLPGTAKTRIASSVSVSPMIRNGMQASSKRLEIRKMALAGALAY